MLGYQYWMSWKVDSVRTRGFNHEGPRRGPVFVASDFAKQIADIEKGASAPVRPRRESRRAARLHRRARHGARPTGWRSRSASPARSTTSAAGKAWTHPRGARPPALDDEGEDRGASRIRRGCARATCRSCSATHRSSRRPPAGSRRFRSSRRCATCWSTGAPAERRSRRAGSRAMIDSAARRLSSPASRGFVGPHVARDARGTRRARPGPRQPSRRASARARELARRRHRASREPLAAAIASRQPDVGASISPGRAAPARSFEQPVETFRVNALGTWNLLEAVRRARAARARARGRQRRGRTARSPRAAASPRSAPLRPVSPYALSKAAADAFAEIAAGRAASTWCARARSATPGPARRRAS